MAKGRAKKRSAAPARSAKELQLREARDHLRRELALERRVAQLSRQLGDQARRTQERLFTLGRGLVIDQGWSVVDGVLADEKVVENGRVRQRVAELEAELAQHHRGLDRAGV